MVSGLKEPNFATEQFGGGQDSRVVGPGVDANATLIDMGFQGRGMSVHDGSRQLTGI